MDTAPLASNQSVIAQTKRDLRSVMQVRRQKAYGLNDQAAFLLRDHVLQNVSFPSHCHIASYSPFGTELSPVPLTHALREKGCDILLPTLSGQAAPLTFKIYTSDNDLVPSGWQGIMEPPANAAIHEPDILLVPLLAFDRDLYRLGYGGGYYDRTLTSLRARKTILAIGIAFECQLVDKLLIESHDARLDCVATEARFYR